MEGEETVHYETISSISALLKVLSEKSPLHKLRPAPNGIIQACKIENLRRENTSRRGRHRPQNKASITPLQEIVNFEENSAMDYEWNFGIPSEDQTRLIIRNLAYHIYEHYSSFEILDMEIETFPSSEGEIDKLSSLLTSAS